jgi:hypothetical protein
MAKGRDRHIRFNPDTIRRLEAYLEATFGKRHYNLSSEVDLAVRERLDRLEGLNRAETATTAAAQELKPEE